MTFQEFLKMYTNILSSLLSEIVMHVLHKVDCPAFQKVSQITTISKITVPKSHNRTNIHSFNPLQSTE